MRDHSMSSPICPHRFAMATIDRPKQRNGQRAGEPTLSAINCPTCLAVRIFLAIRERRRATSLAPTREVQPHLLRLSRKFRFGLGKVFEPPLAHSHPPRTVAAPIVPSFAVALTPTIAWLIEDESLMRASETGSPCASHYFSGARLIWPPSRRPRICRGQKLACSGCDPFPAQHTTPRSSTTLRDWAHRRYR